MAIEIERRFLLANDDWRAVADAGQFVAQGYLLASKEKTVRVRVVGERGFLTIKSFLTARARHEFEYPIPADEAQQLLSLCAGQISKTRYRVPWGARCFEIDVFHGDNAPLVLAEIELQSETESFLRPAWLGAEITGDGRYSNAALSQQPYREWGGQCVKLR